MNTETINILSALTNSFYARCADSFSATRKRPWHGWDLCLDAISDELPRDQLSVMDIACGNLRFETFLAQQLGVELTCYAVDSCPELVTGGYSTHFQEVDVIAALCKANLLRELESIPSCDLACSFGFFHHVPTQKLRFDLLDAMISKAAPNGFIMISLWQFDQNEKLRAKAEAATKRALAVRPALDLEEGDWLLSWQDSEDVFRYCHSFSEKDIAELIDHAQQDAKLIDSFQADGEQDDLNRYLIFKNVPSMS